MSTDQLGGTLSPGLLTRSRQPLWVEVLWWVSGTLLVTLAAFPFTFLIYRVVAPDHSWPTHEMVFGRGDLAIAALALIGGIVAEIRESSRLQQKVGMSLLIVTVLLLLAAIAAYSVSQAQSMLGKDWDKVLVSQVTSATLIAVIGIQLILFALREK